MMKSYKVILFVAVFHFNSWGQTAYEYIETGIAKFQLRDYAGALTQFNKAIELQPDLSEAYNNRGIIKNILNDSIGSVNDFNKAIALAPNNISAYKNRAFLKMRKYDYFGALKDFDTVLQLDSKDEVALKNCKHLKQLVTVSQNNRKKNIKREKDSVTTPPINPKIEMLDLNKHIEDNGENNKILKKKSSNAIVENTILKKQTTKISPQEYVTRGSVKAKRNEYKEAFEDYNKAIELDSAFAQAYYYRGLLKSSFRNHKNELQHNNSELSFEKRKESAIIIRELSKGDFGAIEDYTKAIELNHEYADAYYYRGMSFYNLKEYKNAIANFDAVTRLNKNFADAYYYKGMAKGILADRNGSCMDFIKASELGNTEAKDMLKDCK
jgi:tetratricopeptide (TPR) repeat protein